MSNRVEDMMERARAGDPAAYDGEWEVTDQAFTDREPEVLVSKSLRLSLTTYEQVRTIAATRRMSPSSLMRQWIEEGVTAAQEETGQLTDPVSLVDRVQADVARLAHALRNAA